MSAQPQHYPQRDQRWQSEAEFFDRQMDAAVRPLDPRTLFRYEKLRRRRFHKEYRFRAAGELKGKSVLDLGCGDGVNSILFAAMGAAVTGIDVSPKSIERARAQAEINGLGLKCRFLCAPVETAELADHSFDVVWADAFLHHVLPDLDFVMGKMVRWAKPGGLVMCAEPVNLFNLLRKFRLLLPVAVSGTPDERPLEPKEVAVIERHLPGARRRGFQLLARIDRLILVEHCNYERSPWYRRRLLDLAALIDYGVLSLPLLDRLAGVCVFSARIPA